MTWGLVCIATNYTHAAGVPLGSPLIERGLLASRLLVWYDDETVARVQSIVDKHGSISFAGTGYRVGNRYVGTTVEVRLVSDTVQIALDGALLRTHRARHDKTKEFGALANPGGRPRRINAA